MTTWINNLYIMGGMVGMVHSHDHLEHRDKLEVLRCRLHDFIHEMCISAEYNELEDILDIIDPIEDPGSESKALQAVTASNPVFSSHL